MDLDSAVMYSKDIDRIANYYENFMGFKLHSRQGDRFVSFIFPNGGKLSIRIEKGEREIAGHQTVFITCKDIQAKYNELKDKGAVFYRELEKHDWGESFDILDLDNNKVEFINYS